MEPKKRKRNIEKLRHTQGCLTDCVAYMLNIHPHNVPFFVYPREGWNGRLKLYLFLHGFVAHWEECSKPPKRGMHLVIGDSLKWKTAAHAVVYKNGKMVYDPQYPSKWKDKRTTHRLVLKPL